MKLNYETCLVGSSSILVPYRREHVQKYHDWMLDPALLEATASEPLALQEEYDMQESWRDDPEKCTFIVLAREAVEQASIPEESDGAINEEFVQENLKAMVGDVNLFLSDEENDDSDQEQSEVREGSTPTEDTTLRRQAEVDIMIAEAEFRGNGLGKEAACLMMMYGATHLDVRRFFCKINEDNTASLALFRKLGFQQCAYAECFKEIELELKRESTDEMVKELSAFLGKDTLQSFQCTSK
jgi:RimJ/RimL family protein N-acetyltransferase